MTSTTIPIQSTFDIARGRNSLRTHIAAQRWTPVFGARASAALTALGELILYAEINNVVVVRLRIVEVNGAGGIELMCAVAGDTHNERFTEAQTRLRRAVDELEMEDGYNGLQITARLWMN